MSLIDDEHARSYPDEGPPIYPYSNSRFGLMEIFVFRKREVLRLFRPDNTYGAAGNSMIFTCVGVHSRS
jgi:hypothetical protein